MIETIIFILFFAFVIVFLIRIAAKIGRLEAENEFYKNSLLEIVFDSESLEDAKHEAKTALITVAEYRKVDSSD